MSVPSSEELRRTGQVIPTSKLVAWARESGFETRRSKGGTSHIIYRHKDYPDISGSFIATSDKLSSQRNLADSLLELKERKLAKSFEKAQNREQEILAKIPDHLKAEFDPKTGVLVITDRQLPQLGMTVAPRDFHLIENKIDHILGPQKRIIFELLGRCRTENDMDVNIPRRGTFDGILAHNVYNLPPITIPPYKAGDDTNQFADAIGQYVNLILEKDAEHDERLKKILGMSFVQEIDVVPHAKRGTRTYVIHYENAGHRPLKLNFDGYSNRRVTLKGDHTADPNDIHRGRVSEAEMANLERKIFGIAAAHAQAGSPAFERL